MANEAFACVKMEEFLKGSEWSLTDGRRTRFEWPFDISTSNWIADRKHRNQMGWIKMSDRRIVADHHDLLVETASHHP